MEKYNIKVEILPNQFLKENGTFNKKEALNLAGKIAGVCYDPEGFNHLINENENKTERRIKMTLNNGHHSVYDHISISFNLRNIPKMLAMVLNNEHQYTTSEKSARYTKIVRDNNVITEDEERLYNKWLKIFEIKIKEKYGYIYNDNKIRKLAQENARYLVTVFMPTQMIYTTSLRQINYIASWMSYYIVNSNIDNDFECKLSLAMREFLYQLMELNVLDIGLMKNDKSRKLSLFGEKLDLKNDHFDYAYSYNYNGSLAQLAQAQRHRTLNYQMEFLNNNEYFIPEIIKDDKDLVDEWYHDINSVNKLIPQGMMVKINESGTYDNFILKCKERLCSEAQYEIMAQTKEILTKYKEALIESNHYLKNDIIKYTHGARCTFPDFKCPRDCKFAEGKKLIRKI